MTSIVPGDPAIKTRTDIFRFQNVHQKSAQFISFCGDLFRSRTPRFVFRKKPVKMFHHRSARTRRADDSLGIAFLEDLNKTPGEFLCFSAISGVKSRLPAAGLAFVKDNFATRAAQNLDRAGAYIR